jgi:hypothetical protein
MLSWLPRQRGRMERIEVEAETMISDFGADAYFEARRREHESSSDAIAKDWDQIALAVARRVSVEMAATRVIYCSWMILLIRID